MTITIELPPDVAREITARAARSGQDAAGYVEQLATRDARAALPGHRTPEERATAFVLWAKAHGTSAPPLSDEAVSRESFYAEDGIAADAQDGPATEALRLLIVGQCPAFVTPQTLTEFWRGATRPLDAAPAGLGLTPDQAAAEVAYYRDTFDFLPDTPEVFEEWLRVARIHAVRGARVHDARLVAVMHTHGVARILTTNVRDFARFPRVQAVTPEELPALLRAEAAARAEGEA